MKILIWANFTKLKQNMELITPTQWVKRTNVVGIKSSSGKYSIGTFAHPDIAFEVASWKETLKNCNLTKQLKSVKIRYILKKGENKMNIGKEQKHYDELMNSYERLEKYRDIINDIIIESHQGNPVELNNLSVISIRFANPGEEINKTDKNKYRSLLSLTLYNYKLSPEQKETIIQRIMEEFNGLSNIEQLKVAKDISIFLATSYLKKDSKYSSNLNMGEKVFKPFILNILSSKEILRVANFSLFGKSEFFSLINGEMEMFMQITDANCENIALPRNDLSYIPLLLNISERSLIQDYRFFEFAKNQGYHINHNLENYNNCPDTLSYLQLLIKKDHYSYTDFEREFLLNYCDKNKKIMEKQIVKSRKAK